MKIESIYPKMNQDAANIPMDLNVKMVIRHSFREPLVNDQDYKITELNDYGVLQAKNFGNSIQYPIGELYSSKLNRCIQTLTYMIPDNQGIHIVPEYLTNVFTYNSDLADVEIGRRKSLKRTIVDLKNGIAIPGFYKIDDTVKKMLDFIFSTGNQHQSLDIYCTHDFHIGMLLVILFNQISSFEELQKNWPNMLEGLFLYGTRDSFWCIWRGSSKHFKDFLR